MIYIFINKSNSLKRKKKIMITNAQIAKEFDKLASIIEFLDRKDPADPFRIRTYRKVANIIRNYDDNIFDLWKNWKLEKINWLGKETWSKLLEFLETWKISAYEKLKQNIPDEVIKLMDVPWIWPKLAKQLYEKLNIESIEDLETLLEKESEKILSLPRMWEKKLEQIKKWLQMYQFTKTRTPLGIIYPYAHSLLNEVKSFPEVKKAEIAGSLRRMKETIWDIDILVISKAPVKTMEKFKDLDNVENVLVFWDTKTSVFLKYPHIQVDLRIVPEDSFWAALQYFTGSKEHNIHLRTIAKEKWYKISEYWIFKIVLEDEKSNIITDNWVGNEKLKVENSQPKAGIAEGDNNLWWNQDNLWLSSENKISYVKVWWKTEEEIYNTLGLDWIIPEMRQDLWEIELAMQHKLPDVVSYDDLKWDLHVHSNWSDGANTIEEMVQAAIELNYQYIAITDHSPSLSVANGLSKDRFFARLEEIRQLRQKYTQIKILVWTEVDILSDWSLDYDEEVLKSCDIVVASIHRWFSQDQTERYLKAMDNPYVTVIWHPTDRLIWERDLIKADWEKVFKKAIDKWILMEINCQPLRLDLPDFLIRKFDKMGGYFFINTDAHSIKCLTDYSKYGIWQARRAWVEKRKIVNTYCWEDFVWKLNINSL